MNITKDAENWIISRDFYRDVENLIWNHCPDQFEDESISSWFTRTTKMNCAGTLETFHELMKKQILFEHIETVTSVKCNLIKSLEPYVNINRLIKHEYNPQALMKHFFLVIYSTPKYCPFCLKTDNIPYFRFIWQLPFVTVCPNHHILLLTTCPSCQSRIQYWRTEWNRPIYCCNNCQYDLRENYVMENKKLENTHFQDDLVSIYQTSSYNDEKIDNALFFENLYRVARITCPDQEIHWKRIKDLFKIEPFRMYLAVNYAFQRFQENIRIFLDSPISYQNLIRFCAKFNPKPTLSRVDRKKYAKRSYKS